MQALIVSGGCLDGTFAAAYVKSHSFGLMIAADSGMGFFAQNGWVPDYIVGDFDSARPEILQGFSDAKGAAAEGKKPVILQFQPEKDETDTEIAVRTAIGKGCGVIHLLGATGTRVDHMMGNIHLLGMAMEQGVECLMVDPHNRIRMVRHGLVLKKEEQYGDYVSLLPFTPEVTGLTLRGMKYPLERAVMKCYHSLGVSNEIVGEQAEISFQEGVLLVVESRD